MHISVLSLCAEHLTLQHNPGPHEPTSLRRARRLIASISTFQNALDKYRDSVYRSPPLQRNLRGDRLYIHDGTMHPDQTAC